MREKKKMMMMMMMKDKNCEVEEVSFDMMT